MSTPILRHKASLGIGGIHRYNIALHPSQEHLFDSLIFSVRNNCPIYRNITPASGPWKVSVALVRDPPSSSAHNEPRVPELRPNIGCAQICRFDEKVHQGSTDTAATATTTTPTAQAIQNDDNVKAEENSTESNSSDSGCLDLGKVMDKVKKVNKWQIEITSEVVMQKSTIVDYTFEIQARWRQQQQHQESSAELAKSLETLFGASSKPNASEGGHEPVIAEPTLLSYEFFDTADICGVKIPEEEEKEEDGEEEEKGNGLHLVVLTHGIHGTWLDMLYLKEQIDQESQLAAGKAPTVVTFLSDTNHGGTEEGIQMAGQRVAREILGLVGMKDCLLLKKRQRLNKGENDSASSVDSASDPSRDTDGTMTNEQNETAGTTSKGEGDGSNAKASPTKSKEKSPNIFNRLLTKSPSTSSGVSMATNSSKSTKASTLSNLSKDDESTAPKSSTSAVTTTIPKTTTDRIKRISFIGHSLGGLINIYAIGYLQEATKNQFFEQIQPIHFTTVATPLLGVTLDHPWVLGFALSKGVIGQTGIDLALGDRRHLMINKKNKKKDDIARNASLKRGKSSSGNSRSKKNKNKDSEGKGSIQRNVSASSSAASSMLSHHNGDSTDMGTTLSGGLGDDGDDLDSYDDQDRYLCNKLGLEALCSLDTDLTSPLLVTMASSGSSSSNSLKLFQTRTCYGNLDNDMAVKYNTSTMLGLGDLDLDEFFSPTGRATQPKKGLYHSALVNVLALVFPKPPSKEKYLGLENEPSPIVQVEHVPASKSKELTTERKNSIRRIKMKMMEEEEEYAKTGGDGYIPDDGLSKAGNSTTSHAELAYKVSDGYQHEMDWTKIGVYIESEAHVQIIVRRKYYNVDGWPCVRDMVERHSFA